MFLVALACAFTHVLSGRGAFNQIGAIIGTVMVANVFLVIIPNQNAKHVRRNARLIGRYAVWANAMTPENITEMTGEERAVVAAWLASELR